MFSTRIFRYAYTIYLSSCVGWCHIQEQQRAVKTKKKKKNKTANRLLPEAAHTSAKMCGWKTGDVPTQMITVFISMLALSIISVIVRLYVRLFIQSDSKMGVDDWLTMFNLISWIAFTLLVLIGGVPRGMARNSWEMSPNNVESLALIGYISQTIYTVVNATVKLAFLFFYLRIFLDQKIRRVLLGTIVLISCYGVAFTFASIFACRPVDYFWKQWTNKDIQGVCISYLVPQFVYSGIGILLDLFILFIPMGQLRLLKLSWKKKLSVGLMFSGGIMYV